MKNIVFAFLMLFALNTMAQEGYPTDPKLEALKKEKNKAALAKKIKSLEQGTAEDLDVLIQYYEKDNAKRELFSKKLLKKYPSSSQALMVRMQEYNGLSDPDDIAAVTKSFMKQYPNINLDPEKNMAALIYAEVPDTTTAMTYMNMISDKVYRIYALKLMLDILEEIDYTLALSLADRELATVLPFKDDHTPSAELNINPQMAYGSFIDTYSKLLTKAKRYDEAYKYTSQAMALSEDVDQQLIENNAFLSSLNGEYVESLPILAEAVKGGKTDPEYLAQIRKAYAHQYPGQDVEVFIADLKKAFADKMKAHVASLMIDEEAPAFFISDANGKKVTLADFKGKTIVLDFWATWCGPCVASFPAMQLAVDRFANDKTVEFLFIHTWENVADPLADAKSFLAKRNYHFDLYVDQKDPVTNVPPAVTAFGAKGIPAKFIIDGEGRIRFKLEGFEGTDEAAAEEVVQMVEMARQGK